MRMFVLARRSPSSRSRWTRVAPPRKRPAPRSWANAKPANIYARPAPPRKESKPSLPSSGQPNGAPTDLSFRMRFESWREGSKRSPSLTRPRTIGATEQTGHNSRGTHDFPPCGLECPRQQARGRIAPEAVRFRWMCLSARRPSARPNTDCEFAGPRSGMSSVGALPLVGTPLEFTRKEKIQLMSARIVSSSRREENLARWRDGSSAMVGRVAMAPSLHLRSAFAIAVAFSANREVASQSSR